MKAQGAAIGLPVPDVMVEGEVIEVDLPPGWFNLEHAVAPNWPPRDPPAPH